MPHRVACLADHRQDLGEIHFRRRLLVVGPQRRVQLRAVREERLAQPADFLDALGRGRRRDRRTARHLLRVDALQLIERLRPREVRISHHGGILSSS